MSTITSANSVYLLSIIGLFPAPQLLQGYSADAAFETDSVEPSEVIMGVDGRMSAGFVPFMTKQTISLMPDSPSVLMFEAWLQAQKAINDIYPANAVITLPSINRSFVLTFGVITGAIAIPPAKKVLGPRNFIITWQDISPVPV